MTPALPLFPKRSRIFYMEKEDYMKKLINAVLIVIAYLTLIGVTSIVRAQQNNNTAGENSKKGSDYALPYPGILPDHPLYSIKMFRDKIISFFINTPQKKAEFRLLMADKRVNSGLYLVNREKMDLAITTISKGQNYLDQALTVIETEKSTLTDGKSLLERLVKATAKHEEVINTILKKASDLEKPAVRDLLERTKQAQEKIKKLMK